MNFNKFMSTIPIRGDILDDITYLQKHLRLVIKYHQKLSSKLHVNPYGASQPLKTSIRSRNYYAIRKLMDRLEDEMEDISQEQRFLTEIVRKYVNSFLKSLKDKHNLELDRDLANGYITRAIQYNYERNYFVIAPNNVKVRMTEEILEKKFGEVNSAEKEDDGYSALQFQDYARERGSLLKQNNFRKPSSSNEQRKHTIENRKLGKGKRNDSGEFQSGEGITHSRMNLLRALNRVKNDEKDTDGNMIMKSDEEFSEKSSYADAMDDRERFQFTKIRKRKSPTAGIHSEESSDGDYMKYYPNLHEEPTPREEYNQVEFLEMFKLITPETFEKMKIRRSERKKRTCTKNQKTDFHYGNFDLNEAAYRVRLNNKKSLLYAAISSKSKGKWKNN